MLEDLTCVLCEKVSVVLTFGKGKNVCLLCVNELKKFQYYAPMPNQEQPGNYFPKIGMEVK